MVIDQFETVSVIGFRIDKHGDLRISHISRTNSKDGFSANSGIVMIPKTAPMRIGISVFKTRRYDRSKNGKHGAQKPRYKSKRTRL